MIGRTHLPRRARAKRSLRLTNARLTHAQHPRRDRFSVLDQKTFAAAKLATVLARVSRLAVYCWTRWPLPPDGCGIPFRQRS